MRCVAEAGSLVVQSHGVYMSLTHVIRTYREQSEELLCMVQPADLRAPQGGPPAGYSDQPLIL